MGGYGIKSRRSCRSQLRGSIYYKMYSVYVHYREEGGQNNAYATGNDNIDELWLREEERGVFLRRKPLFGLHGPIATRDLDKTASVMR